LVGKSFPVIKISGHQEWDFILPVKPDISFAEACARRDFTINSMMMDVLSGEIIDFYGGRNDITKQIIRYTNPDVFAQDPLRVYRAVYFAARSNFAIHPKTIELIIQTDLSSVNRERIYEELKKLLMLSPQPSIGLRYLQITGVLKRMHPLLFKLIACEQSPQNHPEGDVWEHTLLVVDQAARLKASSLNPEAFMFAALLHDIGKPDTTQVKGDKITTCGHDVLGDQLAISFLQELTHNRTVIKEVAILVREHMHPILLYKDRQHVTDKAIRKLIERVNLKELLLIAEADFMGRNVDRDFDVIRTWFMEKVFSLGLDPDKKIEPLVQGRDLLKMGFQPGPAYTKTLAYAFDLQLEGKTKEAILEQVQHYKPQ
jgi:tRNA nucleotidyltransferase (CCA-adding enzyme)